MDVSYRITLAIPIVGIKKTIHLGARRSSIFSVAQLKEVFCAISSSNPLRLTGLMAYEVLSAFFLEAGFLGVMLFGLNKVGKKLHFLATCMVAFGTFFSAFSGSSVFARR